MSAFLAICVVWGLSLVVAYDLLDTGIPPFFLMAVTYGLGALVLLPAKAVRRSAKIRRGEWKYGAIIGLVILVAFGLQTVGLEYTTPAKSGLQTVLYVLFVPIIVSVLRRKLSARSIVFAVIGFAGIAVMSGITGGDASMNIGDVLTIMCAVAFAAQFVMLEKYSSGLNPVNFTFVQMLTAAAVAIVISLAFESGEYASMDLIGSWVGLLFMGLIVTGLGFFVQTAVQRKIPATTISVMCCTESVFALIFSWFLGYDTVTSPLLIGAALIILSTVLSSAYENRELMT
ncbi:MAG: DMT family transporter [Candidatus Methanoplasma sp.]|nr:DMT family transporter [Candidatus Methanoplasma sp.]